MGYGRFGIMFEKLNPAKKVSDEGLNDIATAMIKKDEGAPINISEPIDENPTIPAGYTYFGQFIDHDISFDPTSLNSEQVDVSALEDFRTPALDLDSVYGSGPDNQPYMYDGVKFRVGRSPGNANAAVGTGRDLFRLAGDPSKQVAIIGDKRNDENKITSQIHSMFIEMHNKVVDEKIFVERAGGTMDDDVSRFRAANLIVRWHYQYAVVHDFLMRICQEEVVRDVLNAGGHMPRLGHYLKMNADFAYLPVEFSGAAFRFGHSMVRPSYALNARVGTEIGEHKNRLPTFSQVDKVNSMTGFPGTLPNDWGLDWSFFLDGFKKPDGDFRIPQPSYRIDALLADPLKDLPEFPPDRVEQPFRNLAFRNLRRGQLLNLPSGQDVAAALGLEPLSDDVLWGVGSIARQAGGDPEEAEFPEHVKEVGEMRDAVKQKWVNNSGPLHQNTPLWYYILREAEYFGVERLPTDPLVALGGQHLGPVGSRIVAETLIGLLWKDKSSFIHSQVPFRPFEEIAADGKLDQLVQFALM